MDDIKGTIFLRNEGKAKLALGEQLSPFDFSFWPESLSSGEFKVCEIVIRPEQLLDRDTACLEAAEEIDRAIQKADAEHAAKVSKMQELKRKLLALPAPESTAPAVAEAFDSDIPF